MRMMQTTFNHKNHNPTSQRDLHSGLAAELRKSSMQTKTDRQTDNRKEGRKERRKGLRELKGAILLVHKKDFQGLC